MIFGQGTLIFPMGTQLEIEDTLIYPNSMSTLLSYKDIYHKGFHVKTHNDNNNEYQFIIKLRIYQKMLERIPSTSTGLYYTYIKPVEMLHTR